MSDPGTAIQKQQAALSAYLTATTPAEERAAYARMMELGMPKSYGEQTETSDQEVVARAICKAMNINPDGFSDAHKFHATQDRIKNGQMWTIRNWEAAEHVAEAAMKACAR